MRLRILVPAPSDTGCVWLTRRPSVTLESENLSDSCPIPNESPPTLTKPLLLALCFRGLSSSPHLGL